MKSKEQIVTQTTIDKGLTIYKRGRSPYWYVRIWIPSRGGYLTKSTKESSKLSAREVALELYRDMNIKGSLAQVSPKLLMNNLFDELMEGNDALSGKDKNVHFSRDDRSKIEREKDGLRVYFGGMNIRNITTFDLRDYLKHLDENRGEKLSPSYKNKHMHIMSKVFNLAYEQDIIEKKPIIPKVERVDKPRPSFTKQQYKTFIGQIRKTAKEKIKIKGQLIDMQFYYFCVFMTSSFLRPTDTEVFALKFEDITIDDSEESLSLRIKDGKTGWRKVTTLPNAVDYLKKIRKLQGNTSPKDYLFYPKLENRDYCRQVVARFFNYILKECNLGLSESGEKLTLYSLRHYAIQERLVSSGGKVNPYILAKNAGTSMDMLQRFYLKHLDLSKEMKKNLQQFS